MTPDPPILRLACPACGGMLPIPPGTSEFVTCPFCSNNLQVRRNHAGVTLELAQQMGAAIGREIGTTLGQEMARARQETQRQAAEGRLQQIAHDMARANTDYQRWEQAVPGPQRTQALQQVHMQWQALDQEYRALYQWLYPDAPLPTPATTRASPTPQAARLHIPIYPGRRPEIRVKTYKNAKDFQHDANKMLREGWSVQHQSGMGKITVTWTKAGIEPQKGCPQCGQPVPIAVRSCHLCNYVFP